MRICFFGDSFTHGVGDVEGLGWRGRVVARLLQCGVDLTAYDLGVRRDTSADILKRWEQEACARFPHELSHNLSFRLAFAFGTNDCSNDGTGKPRLSLSESLSNAERILTKAVTVAPSIMIGPAPTFDDPEADKRLHDLETRLQLLAGEYGVPFLPMMAFLQNSRQWTEGAAVGDGTHPGSEGYALMAEHILAWSAFQDWIS